MHHHRPGSLILAFTASMLLWASIEAPPVTADLITFAFDGRVTSVGSSLLGSTSSFGNTPFTPDSLFLKGTYRFDSSTPPFPSPGIYPDAISILTFQLRDTSDTLVYSGSLSTITPNTILVTNNLLGPDMYVVSAPFSGTSVNTHNPNLFSISLSGPASVFSDTSLPTTPPSLSSFTIPTQFNVIFDGGVQSVISGIITSLAPVPLPPAFILFGAGLVGLVGLGARSWRQKGNSLA